MINSDGEALFSKGGGIAPSWRNVFAAMIAVSSGPSVFLVMCFAVFTPAMRAEFGWNTGDVTIAAMFGLLCVAIISPIQGRLCDRFGSRLVILVSFPLFGLSLIALSQLSSDIYWFYLGYVAATVCALGIWPLSFMRCVSTWFNRRLGFALGVVNVGLGLGGALAPLMVGALISSFGWRISFLVCGLIVLCLAWPIAMIWLREKPFVTVVGKPVGLAVEEVRGRGLLTDRPFWLLVVTFWLLGMISGGVLLNQVTIMTDNGLSRQMAIASQSALGVASIVARLVTGWLLDRTHIARLMPGLLIFGAAACWLYTMPSAGALMLISAVIFGFILGAEFDVLGYAIRRYNGLASFGLIYGIVFAVFSIGSAMGVRSMGLVHNAYGTFSLALLVLAGLCVVIAVLFALMGPYRFFSSHQTASLEPSATAAA